MNTTFLYLLLFSLVGGLLSLVGGIVLSFGNKKSIERFSKLAVPFAAGSLLAAVFLDLLKEGIEGSDADTVLLFALIGVVSFFILERFSHWFHHHHEEDQGHKSSLLIIIADTIHNALDGVAIAAGFLISVPTGVVTAIAVAAHEIPQEVGDFGVLLGRGFGKRKVILINILSSLSTTAVAVVLFLIGDSDRMPLGALFGLSSGFLLYVAASDLIPTIHQKKARKGRLDTQILLLLAGVMTVAAAIDLSHRYLEDVHTHDEPAHSVETRRRIARPLVSHATMGMMIEIILVLGVVNTLLLVISLQKKNGTSEKTLREEMALNRKELSSQLKEVSDSLDKRIATVQEGQLKGIRNLTEVVEQRLITLQNDNSEKLDKMRATVDEKLQSTLERRLGESFKIVSDRLEQVHKGLGEMQGLAVEVGSFKSLMTGIKTRGTWGEVQLESLLEQVFIKDHYEKQVTVSDKSREPVDFAIKLPDKSSTNGFIYMPIDAKFPLEDYQRLVSAQESGDTGLAEQAGKALAARIKTEAKSIKEKYISPPRTTDFAVLYVPTEGLYAEVLRYPGLFESLQSDYRVTVAGPTTIAAILSSYQLGFRTLAIAEQTSQVWEMLTTVKGEFGKFGDLLEKTKEKLDQASRTIESATTKSRTIERKLSKMERLESKTVELLDE